MSFHTRYKESYNKEVNWYMGERSSHYTISSLIWEANTCHYLSLFYKCPKLKTWPTLILYY